MIIAWLYYIICKIIGLTTKLLFKYDATKELRDEFNKQMVEYLTGEKIK